MCVVWYKAQVQVGDLTWPCCTECVETLFFNPLWLIRFLFTLVFPNGGSLECMVPCFGVAC